jgi:hypothetical protein
LSFKELLRKLDQVRSAFYLNPFQVPDLRTVL